MVRWPGVGAAFAIAAVLALGATAPTVTAHGPGARFEAHGTATLLGLVTYDALFIFDGQQNQGVGGAWLELHEQGSGNLVHAMTFEAVELFTQANVEGCWFIVDPYRLESTSGPQVLYLDGVKRVCSDDGFHNSVFTGKYLSVYALELTAVGIF